MKGVKAIGINSSPCEEGYVQQQSPDHHPVTSQNYKEQQCKEC